MTCARHQIPPRGRFKEFCFEEILFGHQDEEQSLEFVLIDTLIVNRFFPLNPILRHVY